jgi:AraC-like DNA-binding protein
MSDLTDAVILLRLVYQAMQHAGIDAEAVLNRVGVAASSLDDARMRTPSTAHRVFWEAVEEVSGDPHAGLHLGEHLPIFRGQVLEYLFLSSPTFGDGLKRAIRHERLLSDAARSRLVLTASECYLTNDFPQDAPRHTVEAFVCGLQGFFRHITEGAFAFRELHFRHGEGADAAEYERVYGCPVRLGSDGIRLYFDRLLLARPSPHAEPELLALHEQVASARMAELERHDLVRDVRRIIGESLEEGDVSLEQVAARLGIKPRALRTRLTEAGTSFNQVLGEYRCRLAKRLLARTDESIDQIVYLTGFSEPSTFYRAFKRWVGDTPVEYRRKRRQGG